MLYAFNEAIQQPLAQVGLESQHLGRLMQAGIAVVPGFVYSSWSEEQFYLSNNLPENLRQYFKQINVKRLDEDRLFSACEQAQKLLVNSYLLEEFIGQTNLALQNLGLDPQSAVVQLRRPAVAAAERAVGRRGALLALKRLWLRAWDFEVVLARLDHTGSFALEVEPTLLLAGASGQLDRALSHKASVILGSEVRVTASDGVVNGVFS
jgi:hypothetical protein